MLPFSVRGCRRAAGLVFGTKMVLDRYWLSLDGVNRNRTATMLIVQAPVGWRQSLARFYLYQPITPQYVSKAEVIRTDKETVEHPGRKEYSLPGVLNLVRCKFSFA